ncbi:hypothetical protein VTI28DRAFT_1172 [Corynascus sepedonium]
MSTQPSLEPSNRFAPHVDVDSPPVAADHRQQTSRPSSRRSSDTSINSNSHPIRHQHQPNMQGEVSDILNRQLRRDPLPSNSEQDVDQAPVSNDRPCSVASDGNMNDSMASMRASAGSVSPTARHHQFETPSVNETRKNTTTFSKFRCAHAGDPNIVVSSKRNSTETEIAEKVIEEDEYVQQGICRPNLVGDSSYVYLWQSQYPTVIADADINDSDREDEEWVRIGKAT